ncbi:MAG: hypothetical protein RJB68_1625, partial [Pseudomonadota bacterium]
VLSYGRIHASLLDNVGNIALLQRAQAAGLLPGSIGSDAAQSYRELRHIQHTARLNESPTTIVSTALPAEQAAGLALWAHVFGT